MTVPGGAGEARPEPLPICVRRARPEDRDAVMAFASTTWDGWDYIPDAWPQWIDAADGVMLVALPAAAGFSDAEGRPLDPAVPIAVCRVALLAPSEAWFEGIRVDPRVRGRSVATTLQVAELRWAAAQGARVVRYVTGEGNEASLRLGARHDFAPLRDRRSYGPSRQLEPPPATWPEVRDALHRRGLVVEGNAAADWWPRIDADATFRSGDRLYEQRAWTLLELTSDRLAAHAAAGELLAVADGERWAIAIRPRYSGWGDDAGVHIGLLLGSDAASAAGLVQQIDAAAGFAHQVRLPDPDPPLLADGGAEEFAAIGYRPHEHVLKVVARPLDADRPLPQPEAPGLLTLLEEPAPIMVPPPIG